MHKNLLFSFVSLISLLFILASSVEAKRFGGGASFGGKRSYSSPFKQKTTQQKSFSQQKASAANQQRKQQLSSRGGLMGMLGGLALGGLLGALFFGGAFENINFFDLLIIGGIIWAVIWFMKRKMPTPQAKPAAAGVYNADIEPQAEDSYFEKHTTQKQFELHSDKMDASFSDDFAAGQRSSSKQNHQENNKGSSFAESFGMNFGQSQNTQQVTQPNEIILPQWFHQQEFLDGARSAYTLLQQAWDKGDLQAIKGLTTESVYNEISHQLAAEPSQGITRIVQLDAKLLDFNELEQHSEASVLFDALLDEADSDEDISGPRDTQGRAAQVRELWHFVRKNNSAEPTWYLDGLQQLE